MSDRQQVTKAFAALTPRERDILAAMVTGLSAPETAEKLFVAPSTVRWYIKQIYNKLGVNSRQEALQAVEKFNLLGGKTPPLEALSNLPAQITPFIGRERELSELVALLADPHTRLITVLAPGGMGKTRLALEAAEQQVYTFPDGVFFVSLAPLASPEQIIGALGDAIEGFQFYPGGEPQQQLLDYLKPKQLLLVLDNYEHLLEGAPLVSAILSAAPRVQVLTTSRERLNLQGEVAYGLSGMAFPDRRHQADTLDYDAGWLFLSSARRMSQNFKIAEGDLKHLAHICHLVEGMPLGIVLAAAWVDVLSLKEIAEEISQSFDFLAAEMRDAPRHQQSIRAVFEPTWNRLTEVERGVCMRFSVFRGGCTRQAAQAITNASLAQLQLLLSKALISRNIEGRYEMHELLRQYVKIELENTGDAEAAVDAHSAYYLNFMAERETDIKGRRQVEALDEIEADFENVRAGWLWAVKQNALDPINSAVESLYWFCLFRSRWQENSELFRIAQEYLAALAGSEAHFVWARVLWRSNDMYYTRNLTHLETALAVARQYDDRAEIAACLREIGDLSVAARDYARSIACLEESLALFQELSDEFNIAWTFHRLAYGYGTTGNSALMVEYSRQGLDISRKTGDEYSASICLSYMGWIIWLTEDVDEGEAYLQEALTLSLKVDDKTLIAVNKVVLGWIALFQGDIQRTKALGEETLTSARDIHDQEGIGGALSLRGFAANLEEDYAEGRRLFEESAGYLAPNPFHTDMVYMGAFMVGCGMSDEAAMLDYHQRLLLVRGGGKQTLRFQILSSALLLAYQGEAERAVELLGLYFALPANVTAWIDKWPLMTRLRTDLEAELGAEVYQIAWERGAKLDVDTVTAALLVEYEADQS